MAFCPNCGTANTEQADRCVACGAELAVPKQKAKFKGTIMMSGIKAPATVPAAPEAAPPPSPPAQPAPVSEPPAPQPPAAARNLNFQKTMMGQPPITLPSSNKHDARPVTAPSAPASAPASLASSSSNQIGHLPTMQHGVAPDVPRGLSPQTDPSPSAANNPSFVRTQGTFAGDSGAASFSRTTGSTPSPSGYGGSLPPGGALNTSAPGYASRRSSMGGAYESTLPPAATSPNPAKVLAVGCGVVVALVLVVGGALWFAFGDRLKRLFGAEQTSAEAAAWQASIVQSLTKINELCRTDCASAAVFFHPLKEAALLDEAKAVTPARLAKLTDTQLAHAAMLDSTEDTSIASELGLDPAQCARVVSEGAKVISCSVPDPGGKPSVLRIVHLSGISSL